MNNKIKSGLFFGTVMAIFFIVQNLLIKDVLTTIEIFKSIITGLVAGAIGGLLFAWIMSRFSNSKFVSETTEIDIDVDDKLIFQTGANHFKGSESVGGKLYLTNKKLIFKSHKFNIQNHELSIKLEDIIQVERYKPLRIANNGLLVKTTQQMTEKFVVNKLDEWISNLTLKTNRLTLT